MLNSGSETKKHFGRTLSSPPSTALRSLGNNIALEGFIVLSFSSQYRIKLPEPRGVLMYGQPREQDTSGFIMKSTLKKRL
jgi:hypothetical protein